MKSKKYSFIIFLAVVMMYQGCGNVTKNISIKKNNSSISDSLTLLKNPDKDRYIGNSTLSKDLADRKPFVTLHLH